MGVPLLPASCHFPSNTALLIPCFYHPPPPFMSVGEVRNIYIYIFEHPITFPSSIAPRTFFCFFAFCKCTVKNLRVCIMGIIAFYVSFGSQLPVLPCSAVLASTHVKTVAYTDMNSLWGRSGCAWKTSDFYCCYWIGILGWGWRGKLANAPVSH